MLKSGIVFLSVWSGFNLLLALSIIGSMTIGGNNAPGLMILFDDSSGEGIETRSLATINALAILFNASAVSLCSLSLILTWRLIRERCRWAFYSVASCLLFLQMFGFVSDSYFESRNLLLNLLSSALLLLGILLTYLGMRSDGTRKPTEAEQVADDQLPARAESKTP